MTINSRFCREYRDLDENNKTIRSINLSFSPLLLIFTRMPLFIPNKTSAFHILTHRRHLLEIDIHINACKNDLEYFYVVRAFYTYSLSQDIPEVYEHIYKNHEKSKSYIHQSKEAASSCINCGSFKSLNWVLERSQDINSTPMESPYWNTEDPLMVSIAKQDTWSFDKVISANYSTKTLIGKEEVIILCCFYFFESCNEDETEITYLEKEKYDTEFCNHLFEYLSTKVGNELYLAILMNAIDLSLSYDRFNIIVSNANEETLNKGYNNQIPFIDYIIEKEGRLEQIYSLVDAGLTINKEQEEIMIQYENQGEDLEAIPLALNQK